MICFLTSSTVIPGTEILNPANRFMEELQRYFPKECRMLFICSDPDDHERTGFFADSIRRSFENAGFRFTDFQILDSRNEDQTADLVEAADLIILAGGHVPTQNRFFHKISLKEKLKDYQGILIGISAGSMNSAAVVYAQPEREGEAYDPDYQRFLEGLGLSETMLVPHYQDVKDDVLDGLRLFEDITYPDSMGRTFYAIPDGSYLFIEEGKEELRGEAYRIRDGIIAKIAEEGDCLSLTDRKEIL